MGASKKIAISVITVALVLLVTLYINGAANDYAVVEYSLSAPASVSSGQTLKVDLDIQNSGKSNAVPSSTVNVVNATIQAVSIPSLASNLLSDYCSFSSTTAEIGNLTVSSGQSSTTFATITVVPNEGVTSFYISSKVSVPFDPLHPQSNFKTEALIPYELLYSLDPSGTFVQS